MKNEELAGYVGVDSGTIWIGDPCYLSESDAITNWSTWCDEVEEKDFFENCEPIKQRGGLLSSTAYGDGSYPVYVTYNSEGRPSSLRIDFEPGEDDD